MFLECVLLYTLHNHGHSKSLIIQFAINKLWHQWQNRIRSEVARTLLSKAFLLLFLSLAGGTSKEFIFNEILKDTKVSNGLLNHIIAII